jgi:hypothetical protein
MAAQALWPTPTVNGNYNRAGLTAKSGDGLASAVRAFPTPLARDATNRSGQAKRYLEQGRVNLQDRMAADGITGSLNPTWVEWLMGWPLGWTGLEPLETAKSRSAPRLRGARLYRPSFSSSLLCQEQQP